MGSVSLSTLIVVTVYNTLFGCCVSFYRADLSGVVFKELFWFADYAILERVLHQQLHPILSRSDQISPKESSLTGLYVTIIQSKSPMLNEDTSGLMSAIWPPISCSQLALVNAQNTYKSKKTS